MRNYLLLLVVSVAVLMSGVLSSQAEAQMCTYGENLLTAYYGAAAESDAAKSDYDTAYNSWAAADATWQSHINSPCPSGCQYESPQCSYGNNLWNAVDGLFYDKLNALSTWGDKCGNACHGWEIYDAHQSSCGAWCLYETQTHDHCVWCSWCY